VGKRVIQMAQEQGLHSFANSIARTRQQIVHRLKQSTVLWEDKCPCMSTQTIYESKRPNTWN
jgi:hypothetical protein